MDTTPDPAPPIPVDYAASSNSEPMSFNPPMVALASLLGTPVAGGFLVSINSLRTGHRFSSLIGLVMGMLLTFSLFGLIPYIPYHLNPLILLPFGAIVMAWVTRSMNSDQPATQKRGNLRAWLVAALTGILCAGALFLILRPYIRVTATMHATPLVISPHQTLYFVPPLTPAHAQSAADSLKKVGYFDKTDAAKSALLIRDPDHTYVLFPIDPKRADDPKLLEAYQLVGKSLEQSDLPKPIVIRLTDPELKKLKDVPIQ